MLNPIWLRTFVTLIETGHFTKTAEKLFMTQPGVSQHISKLEKACGHSLIQREKKTFEITEQGQLVYQYALQQLKDEANLLDKLAFDDPYNGRCIIACSGALALGIYPRLLELQRQHPALVIELKAAPNEQILKDIQHNELDQGIVTDTPPPATYDSRQLGQEQLCLILPARSGIAQPGPEALVNLGLIGHPDAEHYLSLYLNNDPAQELSNLDISDIPVTGYINQLSQILLPVSKGLGFTVLPKSAVDNFPAKEQLVVVKPQKPVMEHLYLVKKKARPLPARFDVLNNTLQQYFEQP